MSSLLDIGVRVGTVDSMMILDRPLALFYDGTRARVLDVLLAATEPISGREVAHRAGLSPTTAIDALGDLDEFGIVTSRPGGRSQLWSVRDDSALIEQMRGIAKVQDSKAAGALVGALGESPVSVVVFGSAARGESHKDSDLDVLLVAEDAAQSTRLRRKSYAASRELRRLVGRPVHITVMDRAKLRAEHAGAFVQAVVRDGRTIRGTALRTLVS